MSQSLSELADEYAKSIDGVRAVVQRTKTEMKKAKLSGNEDKYRLLLRKLAMCYEEIRDMKIVEDTLRGYYTYNNTASFERKLTITEAAV